MLPVDFDTAETDAALFAELIDSVAALGVLSPILARPSPDAAAGTLEILDGIRRWRAARAVGHTVVPVIVHEMDDATAREVLGLGRRRRPIPYHRLVPGSSGASAAEPRLPVVISGRRPRRSGVTSLRHGGGRDGEPDGVAVHAQGLAALRAGARRDRLPVRAVPDLLSRILSDATDGTLSIGRC